MSDWQPIETAPKSWPEETPTDDQAIQLWAENIFGVTRWTFGFWADGRSTDHGQSGWWDAAERAFCTPTHWMPLPPPPVTA